MLGVDQLNECLIAFVHVSMNGCCVNGCSGQCELMQHVGGASAATAACLIIVLPAYA